MKPPALARLLARVAAPREDREFVVRDLDERFVGLVRQVGPRGARRWYRSQVARGLLWRVRPDAGLVRQRAWQGIGRDARMGVRTLRRRPLYAFGVVGTLALGLGSATLVSAVVWAVWLSPMPFPDPDRVVRLYETEPVEMGTAVSEASRSDRRWRISPPLLEDLRAHEWSTLEAVAGVSDDGFDWAKDGSVRRLSVLKVSPEALSILGIVPTAGRLLVEDGSPEIVLTEDFWVREFGADPGVVGRSTLVLDEVPHQVVGVVSLPPGYPGTADVLKTLTFHESQLTAGMRGARYLDVIARVRPGRSVPEAIAEMDAFVAALGETEPQHRGWGADAEVLGDNLLAPFRGILALLLAAGLTFLALAVVNVGGLVAARRAEAQEDRAIRLALGASEPRLLRSSVVESLLLGGAGAGIALLLAQWLLAPLRRLVPQDVPRLAEVSIDAGLVSGVVLVGLSVGAFVGVLGYLMSRGAGPGGGGRRTTTAPGLRGRRYLVAGQVALTTLLTTGGVALLARVSELRGVDVGFDPVGVTSSATLLSEVRYPDVETRLALWRGLEEGLQARGISAAVGVNTPLSGMNAPFGFRVDAAAEQAFAQYHSVGDGYFDVMGIRVLEGRVFGPDDHATSAPVVVISEAFQREHYPAGDAVGRELRVLSTERTIVGVVASTRHFGPDADVQLEMYVPLEQDPWHMGTVLMRTDRADAADVLASVAAEIDPWLALPPPQPYTGFLDEWYAPLRLQLVLVGGLALLGLTLASLGLYALVAYHVTTRKREIGVRMALGAPVVRVFRTVVGQGLGLGVMGALAGLAAWYALLPRTRVLVEGLDSSGAVVPALVAVIVGAACLLATLVPAWRSTAVDPVTTLKAE